MPLFPILQKIWTWIKSQTVIWITTTLVAILTAFSQTITDRIKTGLNNADQRRQAYKSMSKDFSSLIFNAENAIENYNMAFDSLTGHQIDPNNLDTTIIPYNASITTIRDSQYVYKYELNAYAKWKWLIFRTDAAEKYDTLMMYVIKFDSAMHRMNPIAMKIKPLVGTRDSMYTLDKHDKDILKSYLPEANVLLRQTKIRADRLFNSL